MMVATFSRNVSHPSKGTSVNFLPDSDKCHHLSLIFFFLVFKGFSSVKLLTTQSRLLTTLRKKPFENIVGKGENAGNKHFLLFPQCFISFSKQISIFQSHLFCRLQMLSIWTSLKFCRWVQSYVKISFSVFSNIIVCFSDWIKRTKLEIRIFFSALHSFCCQQFLPITHSFFNRRGGLAVRVSASYEGHFLSS